MKWFLGSRSDFKVMRYWFVIHSLESFSQDPDYIGSDLKDTGVRRPSYRPALGFPYVKPIRDDYPDAVVLDNDGNDKKVEFEHGSSNFVEHHHDLSECDFIICREHEWTDMPRELENRITIIPLKEAVPDLVR